MRRPWRPTSSLSPSKESRRSPSKNCAARATVCCLNLTTDDNWKRPEKPTVESSMVVGRVALVIKRNLLIRLQRRVEGLLLRPERQGRNMLVRARAWLLHAGPWDF